MREKIGAWPEETTRLHEQRLSAVLHHLMAPEVESVLDLGCGSGALMERLVANPSLRRIVGLDRSLAALAAADARLSAGTGHRDDRVALRQGTVTDADDDLAGFDAAALVETIEHVDPGHLSRLEHSLFIRLKPGLVVITTPNREYNRVYGMEPGEMRHPEHRFEWDRAKFERWSDGTADRNGYEVSFEGIGPAHSSVGSPTQMAIFRRIQG